MECAPKKTVVENNFFSTEMEALLIPVESGHWYKSGSVTNLIIRNNTFQDFNHSGYNRGTIRFVPDDENKNIAFKNIKIVGNKFNQFDNNTYLGDAAVILKTDGSVPNLKFK